MNKKVLTGLIASASIVGVCLSGISASAAQVDSANTDVGIGFTGHGPGNVGGPLQIKWAPLALDFNTVNTVNTTLQNFNEVTGLNKYVVVDDARVVAATNEWKLSAALTDLVSPTAGVPALTGANLKFNAALQGYTGTAAPEAPGSIVPLSGQTAILTNAAVSISADATAPGTDLMEDDGSGAGAFAGATLMEMSNIQLEVPANAAQQGEQYAAVLTWSLDDTI